MKRFIIVLLFFIVFMPFVSLKAWDSSNGYTGKETAEDINAFDGDYVIQNKYKTWSIFKTMGMTDYQAAAAMACIECECGFKAEMVEGTSSKYELDSGKYSNTTYEKYINSYSMKIEDGNFRTSLTDENLKTAHGITDEQIAQAKAGTLTSAASKHGYNISLSTYYIKGTGYLGCGLYQFTGHSLISLFKWSEKTNEKWFNFENQFAFIIALHNTQGGFRGEQIKAYTDNTKDLEDLDELVIRFARSKKDAEGNEIGYSVVNGNMPDSQIQARQAQAKLLYEEFNGKNWDKVYGEKVLAKAAITPDYMPDYGIVDRSIFHNYGSAVLEYDLNEGFILLDSLNEKLDQNNQDVFKGYINTLREENDTSATHSLFELFGEDLHWYRYMGESTYTPKLFDHIWSAVDQGKTDQLISFDTIFWDAKNYLSCQVYPNRPHVLSPEELENGKMDPRNLTMYTSYFDGADYIVGSIKMGIAKNFIAMVSFMIGPTLQNTIFDLFEFLEDTDADSSGISFWSAVQGLLLVILGLAMLAFIYSLVKKSAQYAKGHGSAPRDIMARFLVGVISLSILFCLIYQPKVFNPTMKAITQVIDNIFNSALADSMSEDEVIAVTDPDLAVHAVLWKTAIFTPWCQGQFGSDYEHLYTTYADLSSYPDPDKLGIMPQSHVDLAVLMPEDTEEGETPTLTETELLENTFYYDSASCTGDIGVPVGGGKIIKNWAAFLYSCGSKYHIDSTFDSERAKTMGEMEDFETSLMSFPHYTLKTTAYDNTLAADTFRVIDAQMDISPQYFLDGSIVENYLTSHLLENEFQTASNSMIFNSALTLFMFPVIFQKLIAFIMIIATVIKLIYYTIQEIFKENSGFSEFKDTFIKHLFNYFVASIKLVILIYLYYKLVGQNLVLTIMYIITSIIVLFGLDFVEAKERVKDSIHKVKQFKKHI